MIYTFLCLLLVNNVLGTANWKTESSHRPDLRLENFALRRADTGFICCDMPDAGPLTVGLFVGRAQHEWAILKRFGRSITGAIAPSVPTLSRFSGPLWAFRTIPAE